YSETVEEVANVVADMSVNVVADCLLPRQPGLELSRFVLSYTFIIRRVRRSLHEFQCHFLKRPDVSAHSVDRRGQIGLQAIYDVATLLPRHPGKSALRLDAFVCIIGIDVM